MGRSSSIIWIGFHIGHSTNVLIRRRQWETAYIEREGNLMTEANCYSDDSEDRGKPP